MNALCREALFLQALQLISLFGTKKIIQRGSAAMSDPLPFNKPFLTEKVPLSFAFHCHFHVAFNKLKQDIHKVYGFEKF